MSDTVKKTRIRAPLSAGLLAQIAKSVSLDAAKQACEKNEAGLVLKVLKQLHQKDSTLALQLGLKEEDLAPVVRIADEAKVNRANAAIVNVACLGVGAGDKVKIERLADCVVLRRA